MLSKRSVKQRQQIAVTYKSSYGKDLKDRLDSELSGNFRRAVLYSFYDMAHVNARACYQAVKGAGTDEQVLIDVICTSTNEEIEALKKAYMDSELFHYSYTITVKTQKIYMKTKASCF
ncbi:unnamed protein product [Dibothriocephalus latus]|uniref:Annexin n=1 Tax=Dibothriocephalus latus TaxID=60516 RepID=A0A3P7N3E7_DIBLA|nr:unnamed protein product [Dibothriocephalus latus]